MGAGVPDADAANAGRITEPVPDASDSDAVVERGGALTPSIYDGA